MADPNWDAMSDEQREDMAQRMARHTPPSRRRQEGPSVWSRILAWLVRVFTTVPETRREWVGRIFEVGFLVVALYTCYTYLPAEADIATVFEEIVLWGLKLLGFAGVGILICWIVLVAFDTMLNSRTVRREVVKRLRKVLPDESRQDDGLYVLSGTVQSSGTQIMLGLILLGCLLAPFI